jgi:methylated-DNA-[protein]-cysteine S-methyltransferase
MMNYELLYRSPIGLIKIQADEKTLTSLQLIDGNRSSVSEESSSGAASIIIKETVRQLDEYFAGKRKRFELPLSPQGTAFQQQVWEQLQEIPYGKTISYAQLAQSVNNPKACRAVGSANGKNPIAIIIPCHRVIAADGGLGGYAYGLDVKKQLLELEKN